MPPRKQDERWHLLRWLTPSAKYKRWYYTVFLILVHIPYFAFLPAPNFIEWPLYIIFIMYLPLSFDLGVLGGSIWYGVKWLKLRKGKQSEKAGSEKRGIWKSGEVGNTGNMVQRPKPAVLCFHFPGLPRFPGLLRLGRGPRPEPTSSDTTILWDAEDVGEQVSGFSVGRTRPLVNKGAYDGQTTRGVRGDGFQLVALGHPSVMMRGVA